MTDQELSSLLQEWKRTPAPPTLDARVFSVRTSTVPRWWDRVPPLATILAGAAAGGLVVYGIIGLVSYQARSRSVPQIAQQAPAPMVRPAAPAPETEKQSPQPLPVVAAPTPKVKAGPFQLTWFDRQGRRLSTFGQPGANDGVVLSPDGTRAAVRDAQDDLWMLDFARGVRARLTFCQCVGPSPIWSPDGSRVVFAGGNSHDKLFEKATSGADNSIELFKNAGENMTPTSWSRDGHFLLFASTKGPKSASDVWVLPMEGDRQPVLFLGTPFNESNASFSPDMRWVAYDSDESGRREVYVRPAPGLGQAKWLISQSGGGEPKWRADGQEIFFQAPPNGTSKMAVEVTTAGDSLAAAVPKLLFRAPIDNGWDVTPDGQRFLLAVAPTGQPTGQQTVQPTPAPIVTSMAPRPVYEPSAVYPPGAQGLTTTTSVKVRIKIDQNGHVVEASVIDGDPVLNDVAIAAVMGWVFQPYTLNGVPTETTTEVTVNFTSGAPSRPKAAKAAPPAR
jgi:TonB family protein